MSFYNSIRPFIDKTIPVDQYGKMCDIAFKSHCLTASFESNLSSERTICFWDLLDENREKVEYTPNTRAKPCMRMASNACFFTDTTSKGGILGSINSHSNKFEKTPYQYANLSVEELQGATIGTIKAKEKCRLIFWDLFAMQEISCVDMGWQGRNMCAMVPSRHGSNLAITLQSGTCCTPNVIALWDSRSPEKPVKEKIIYDTKKDIFSMAIIETSQGPRLVTRSTNSPTIDFRAIFDEAFGEMVKNYDSQFGELVASSDVPWGSGPYSAYDLSLSSTNCMELTTVTKDQWYTGCPGFSEIAHQETLRSYNFTKNQNKTVKPDVTIAFPATIAIRHSAYDEERIVFEHLDPKDKTNKLFISKGLGKGSIFGEEIKK